MKNLASYISALSNPIPQSLHEWIEHQAPCARQTPSTFSLLMIDLDNFKNFNSQFGHAAGDRVLIRVETKLERWLRSPNDVARCGEDEFAVVLQETGKAASIGVGKQILSQIFRYEQVTASIGCATFREQDDQVDLCVVEARMAMWRSQGCGGNLVTHFDDLPTRCAETGPQRHAAFFKPTTP